MIRNPAPQQIDLAGVFQMVETSIIHGYCTLCRFRCGTINAIGNDQPLSVERDLSHPTGKAMCMKGRAAPEIVHSSHRFFFPMPDQR